MATTEILERKDAPVESTWNSEAVFDSWDDFEKELKTLETELPTLSEFAGKLSQGPELLADYYEALFSLVPRLYKLGTYVHMSSVVDTGDAKAKAMKGQAYGLFSKFSATTAFAEPEMLEIGEKLLDWAKEEPRLADYGHEFEVLLRTKDHTRSGEVEEIMGLLQDPFSGASQTASELTNTDLKFTDAVDSSGTSHHVGQSTVTPSGIQSSDRERRKQSWENFYDAHLGMQNTLASNYLTHVKQCVFMNRVRGFDSVLESRLSPHNIPLSVFHSLIDTYKDNLSTWHRYWDVKRKVLGVDVLHPYDIWAPIVEDDPEVSYEQGVDWICEGMAPLGKDYVTVMRRGCLEERWVDYAPNAGKQQGAASSGSWDTPPFIFMSYNDTLMSMSVLAHELGHSMHSFLTRENQPDVYNSAGNSMVAETASNFNQALTRAYLGEHRADDPIFQMALIDEAMFNFHRYFFIMPTLARFEFEVYSRAEQGEPLNADILNEIMKGLYAEGYGDSMADDPDRTQITWAQFGHLFAPFYTFQYSIGISAAHSMATEVVGDIGESRQNYLNFLKAGASLDPMAVFKVGGADIGTPEPVEKTFSVLDDLVTQLDGLSNG